MNHNKTLQAAQYAKIHFNESNGPIDEKIEELMHLSGGVHRPAIVRSMILAALKAGQEDSNGLDLKIMNTTLKEMRYTAKIFSAYRGVNKVTVFGSSRTRPQFALYKLAKRFAEKLAAAGYMVISGGGPGIMQAVNEGAGPSHSFGVNIRLPREQEANSIVKDDPKSINYKYFFNRKLAFLKEASAVALFPGGFGTHDEAMETLTLLQTGKLYPLPVVLLDEPGGTYWKRWVDFISSALLEEGYIDETDMAFINIFDSPDHAVTHINHFYKRYHSLRYVNKRLVIRLKTPLVQNHFDQLNQDFSNILVPGGAMLLSESLPEETDEPEFAYLPRLVIDFDQNNFARLRMLIDAINNYP